MYLVLLRMYGAIFLISSKLTAFQIPNLIASKNLPLATKFNHIKEWNWVFGMQGFISSWRLRLGRHYWDYFFFLFFFYLPVKSVLYFNFLCRSAALINTERCAEAAVTLAWGCFRAAHSLRPSYVQGKGKEQQRPLVVMGGFSSSVLKIRTAGRFSSELQVHETRWQQFTRFQLDPRDGTQNKRTPTESVSKATLHKVIVLTPSPVFVLTLLPGFSFFFLVWFFFFLRWGLLN